MKPLTVKKMNKRIIKTAAVIMILAIVSAILPLFAQWYKQQTGIYPIGTVIVSSIGGLIVTVLSIHAIWEDVIEK